MWRRLARMQEPSAQSLVPCLGDTADSHARDCKGGVGAAGQRVARARGVIILPMLALSGCGLGGAPSIPFFGAFFPAWMLAALIGIAVAILAKLVLVAAGLEAAMPWQLGVCTGLGLIAAMAVGLLAFG